MLRREKTHYANVLTDTDDIAIGGSDGTYLYKCRANTGPKGVPKYKLQAGYANNMLIVKYKGEPIDETDFYMLLQVPCPDEVVPLHPEESASWRCRFGRASMKIKRRWA